MIRRLVTVTPLLLAACASAPAPAPRTTGPVEMPGLGRVYDCQALGESAGAAVIVKHAHDDVPPNPGELSGWQLIAFVVSNDLIGIGLDETGVDVFAREINAGGPYSSLQDEVLSATNWFQAACEAAHTAPAPLAYASSTRALRSCIEARTRPYVPCIRGTIGTGGRQ